MLLSDITDKLNFISILNNKEVDVCGISCNTKTLKDGDIFVCIEGSKEDGHRYAVEAAKKASAVISEKDPGDVGVPVILVEDSREALAVTASVYYGEPSKKLRIIGVTGTNGKTSVALMIKNILEHCGYKVGLIGTVSNMIGKEEFSSEYTTPDAVSLNRLFAQMAEENVNYVVMEVSSHAIAQKRIHGIDFAAGVFTNVTGEHLDYHGTIEEYAKVKACLFENSTISVINSDSEYSELMSSRASGRVVTYGFKDEKSDVFGYGSLTNINGVSFSVRTEKDNFGILTSVPGSFTLSNGLAAAATAYALGIPSGFIRMAFKAFKGIKGRIEKVETGNGVNVFIDYAHTPDALEKIITTINEFKEKRIITLFGCGGDRDATKRPLMGKIATELSDFAIITSDNPRNEDPEKIISDIVSGVKKDNYRVITDRKDAIKEALLMAEDGDIVLLAGKGHETRQIIKDNEIEFDERKIVRELI